MTIVNYRNENKIGFITLNRPEALNALNTAVRKELQSILVDFRDNENVWVAILTGAGNRAFSAGADIKEFIPSLSEPPSKDKNQKPPLRIDQIWKPVIAAINGYCLGGGLELALTCDLRIASENARFGTPEIRVGTLPAGGAMDRLPRFINRAKAAELLIMGQQIDAEEALKIGLINKVVPQDQLLTTAIAWANTILEAGPLQVRAVKECIIRGYEKPLDEALSFEQELLKRIQKTYDHIEGAKAFTEKRKPRWMGR